jgi:type VI secretion system secreted protein VgrG
VPLSDLNDIEFDQSKRLISVESFHLGTKKILITAFEGSEKLSSLSRFRLEIVTHGRALKPSEILGQRLTLALRTPGQVRNFNGIIGQFQAMQTEMRDHYLQVAELVPPAWLLTLNQKCKIFHDKKATDVVSQVLKEAGVTFRLKPAGASREYIVEYCESDFNLISRLLEEEGLFYYFDHGEQNCPMVICNGASDYIRMGTGTTEFYGGINVWQPQYRIGASSFKHAAWDFKAVNVVSGDAKGLAKVQVSGVAEHPVYEYPGSHATADEARTLARARIEEHESQFVQIFGSSSDISMQTAAKFKIKSHAVPLPAASAETDSYAVISVEHNVRDSAGVPFEGPTHYENNFVCIPSEFSFRPPRLTQRPFIHGPQTATVTDGPDEFGRVKVKFHWEDDQPSRWTRVAQHWAYNQMGTQFMPRMDSEVVVEFLNGDPDHPIIVGMVYNGKNKLPFELPANKTLSGIRGANWGSQGVADKSNELRFEDKAGSEEIYLYAQKDFRRVVTHDDTLTVETGNRTLEIKQGNVTETLGQGNHSTTVKLGNHDLKISAGAQTVEAMQSITLKVGSNSIKIDQTGITVKGLMVKIEGTVMLDLKSVMTSVKGDAMLILKGGITMIN